MEFQDKNEYQSFLNLKDMYRKRIEPIEQFFKELERTKGKVGNDNF